MIIRSPRPTEHFTVLQNSVLRDQRLSFKARGVLAYLLSLPDNWQTSAEHLATQSPDGAFAIRSALTELEAVGFIRRTKHRDDLGRVRTVTTVFDRPQPGRGFPPSDNRVPKEEPKKKNSRLSHTHLLT